MTTTFVTIQQFKKVLSNLDKWLDTATAFGEKKKFDANTLLQARLAPDQFPFVKQVQIACDTAKMAAFRLAGKEPPAQEDNEKTLEDLHARVRACVKHLETFKESDFVGAEGRMVPVKFMPGKGFLGSDYVSEFAVPNFYFHATTAYAILRHNGIDLGKGDFLGSLSLKDI
jgi:hypothetical protein